MAKKETIQYLTDLMATIQMVYFKVGISVRDGEDTGVAGGMFDDLCVREDSDPGKTSISVDLYNSCGDVKDVCDGLHGCAVTFDDGTKATGWLFRMRYDPDDVTQLTFLFQFDDDGDDMEIEVEPDSVPEEVLGNIVKWLEGHFPNEK